MCGKACLFPISGTDTGYMGIGTPKQEAGPSLAECVVTNDQTPSDLTAEVDDDQRDDSQK